ncbi:MAG: hypothetical protein RMM17_13395 [Acidobacteriota bacterium]|nr:hypothetical protein [Blastocatellia bacterium]MDW8413663.1 hypothetical protein [Acidobacteriota bacterium]
MCRTLKALFSLVLAIYAAVFIALSMKTGIYETLAFLFIPLPLPLLLVWSRSRKEEDL